MTKASLTERQYTSSTPSCWVISSYAASYPGSMVADHSGVKAPGRLKITMRLPAKMSSDVTSFQSKGFSAFSACDGSMRTRVLNVIEGTVPPTSMGVFQAAGIGGLRSVDIFGATALKASVDGAPARSARRPPKAKEWNFMMYHGKFMFVRLVCIDG